MTAPIFYTETGFIGQILTGMTSITGSLFLTLLFILLLLILIALAFRIPIIATGILYLPLMITLTSMTSDFVAIFGCILIYLGVAIGELILPNGW